MDGSKPSMVDRVPERARERKREKTSSLSFLNGQTQTTKEGQEEDEKGTKAGRDR
jgi:hypothetical protein